LGMPPSTRKNDSPKGFVAFIPTLQVVLLFFPSCGGTNVLTSFLSSVCRPSCLLVSASRALKKFPRLKRRCRFFRGFVSVFQDHPRPMPLPFHAQGLHSRRQSEKSHFADVFADRWAINTKKPCNSESYRALKVVSGVGFEPTTFRL